MHLFGSIGPKTSHGLCSGSGLTTTISLSKGADLEGSVQPYGTTDFTFIADAMVFKLESTPTRSLSFEIQAVVSMIFNLPRKLYILISLAISLIILLATISSLRPKKMNFASGTSLSIRLIISNHFSKPICL